MRLSKKILTVFMALFFLLPNHVFAEGGAVPVEETGSITINYFDDSDQTIPVKDSTWMLFKVGDVITYTDEEIPNVDGLKIESLIPDFEFAGLGSEEPTKPEEVMEFIDYIKNNESELTIKSQLKDGAPMESWRGTTDVNGQVVFEDLPYGVYLGIEVKASRYHVLASPFLISVPYTRVDEETEYAVSSVDVVVEPKAIVAGDLSVIKKTYGNDVYDYEWFTMIFEDIPEGTYRWASDRGSKKGTLKKGDSIAIQAYETITVYDVPCGFKYKITEKEENQRRYKTWYTYREGEIAPKQDTLVVVHNERYKDTNTGTGGMLLISGATFMSASIAGLILLKKKKKEEDK